jgi:hypothetical protein
MNYDERISFLKQWFKTDILTRFNMPRDLDPKIVAMDVIESINRNIPSGLDRTQMSVFVATTAKEVTQSARTRTLPSVKEFIEAVRVASQSRGAERTATTALSLDPYRVNASRIRQGQPVAESYLRDPYRKKLIDEYHLTEGDFEQYNSYLASTAHTQ